MTLALLITGGNGMLGGELVRRAQGAPDIPFARGLTHTELDLTDPFGVRDTVEAWARVVRSDSDRHRLVVVNCAAHTDVAAAENQEDDAYAVNAAGPAVLAAACLAAGARLIQVSTADVFSGEADLPYEPGDPADPVTAYGRTKLAGEQAVREIHPTGAYVVRTSTLYGGHGPSVVHDIAQAALAGRPISAASNDLSSPTWTADLAAALLALARSDVSAGVLHATNRGAATAHDLAQAVCEALGVDPAGVLSADASSAAPRRHLLSEKAWDASGLPPLRPWRDALAEAFRAEGDDLRQ